MYYYVVVFKHESDYLRTFDLGIFHEKLCERFVGSYLRRTKTEKKQIYRDYMKSLADDIDNTEVVYQTKDGYLLAKHVMN